MATPFSAFRKYTGALMAVLCGLLMVSFVVADPLMQMLGGGARMPAELKDTVVVWEGGRLNEIQLEEAVRHRRILFEFQRQVFTLGARDAQAAGVGDLALRVRPLELPSTVQEGVEQDVVRTKILAQRAREAGMVVSDEMIVDYLKGLGRDRVSSDQMRTIMGGMRMGAGRRATIAFVFDLLREAMLARNYLSSHLYVFDTVLPEERWDDWLKVNDRVVLEGTPLPAADFVDQVEEPSDEEIQSYFEEHRTRVPQPDILREYGGVQLASPLPAFATPPRVRLQYVVAKFDDFTEKLMTEVTDEEIAEFYEENKDRFIEADRALFGDDDLFGEDEGSEPAPETELTESESTETTAPEEDAADEAEADPEEPAAEESPEVTAEPAEASPAEDPAAGVEESSEEALEETTETADGIDPPEGVAEEEEEEEVVDGDDVEASDVEASDEAETDAAEADSDGEAESEAGSTEEVETENKIDTTLTYQPLEEVSDEIRRRLAENKAGEAMRDLMLRLKSELDDVYAGYFDAVLDATDAEAEPPAPPAELTDLSALAEANGLTREETEPMSLIQMGETTHGGSINLDPTATRPLPLWHLSFSEGAVDRYEPVLTFDAENNLYLSVISERLENVVPELDDVRDEVVAAWKRDKAADLAAAAAGELAEKIADSGLSIEGYLGENPDSTTGSGAFETDPMSFLTVAGVNERSGQVILRLSQPEPLIEPGPELMTSVFALESGEVGAALNHDRTIAYVLRLATRLAPEDQLRSQFLVEGGTWYGTIPMARIRQFRAASAVYDSVLGEADLEWLRDPDRPR